MRFHSFFRTHDVPEVRSFLDFYNYYLRFIESYVQLNAPLTDLLHKQSKFLWTDTHDDAFTKLKHALTSAPVWQSYDPNLPSTVVLTDASTSALRGVLEQGMGDVRHPVAYYSRKLTRAEKNYPTREQELLGIFEVLPGNIICMACRLLI